jgi:hypothetical protein
MFDRFARRRVGTLVGLLLVQGAVAGAVHFKELYVGLPDLSAQPVLADLGREKSARLRVLAAEARSEQACEPPTVADGVVAICGDRADEASAILRSQVPTSRAGRLSHLWSLRSKTHRVDTIVAEYDVEIGEVRDRYTAFFVLRWQDSCYRVSFTDWFLEGSLQAVRTFGPSRRRNLFVRFSSCTECCAWTYVAAVDLDGPPGTRPARYRFSYASGTPGTFQPELEYVLPGRGHSIEAKVETRLPPRPAPNGIHVLQYFDLEDGADEWWAFRCKGWDCHPEVHVGEPPADFATAWKSASPL